MISNHVKLIVDFKSIESFVRKLPIIKEPEDYMFSIEESKCGYSICMFDKDYYYYFSRRNIIRRAHRKNYAFGIRYIKYTLYKCPESIIKQIIEDNKQSIVA